MQRAGGSPLPVSDNVRFLATMGSPGLRSLSPAVTQSVPGTVCPAPGPGEAGTFPRIEADGAPRRRPHMPAAVARADWQGQTSLPDRDHSAQTAPMFS